jgi:DNA-binding response OmpR family regulator
LLRRKEADVAPKRILIVEDEVALGSLLCVLLQSEGYVATLAVNTSVAARLLDVHRPDLILLDVMLPDVDGLTFCRALQANPATRTIPIVVMTATYVHLEQLDCDVAGALRKPFPIDTLFALLARVLPTA